MRQLGAERIEMNETIKRCPFCGSREVEICRTNQHACWIRCADCGADAQSHATKGRE